MYQQFNSRKTSTSLSPDLRLQLKELLIRELGFYATRAAQDIAEMRTFLELNEVREGSVEPSPAPEVSLLEEIEGEWSRTVERSELQLIEPLER